MEDFISWVIENKDLIKDSLTVIFGALFTIANCVLTLIRTRKTRIKRISTEEAIDKTSSNIVSNEVNIDKMTSEVKKRLLEGGNNEKSKDE